MLRFDRVFRLFWTAMSILCLATWADAAGEPHSRVFICSRRDHYLMRSGSNPSPNRSGKRDAENSDFAMRSKSFLTRATGMRALFAVGTPENRSKAIR